MVKHAVSGQSVRVSVPAAATILDVRHALLSSTGATKLSEVKLVRRQGMSLIGLEDSASLGGRKLLLAAALPEISEKIAAAPQAKMEETRSTVAKTSSTVAKTPTTSVQALSLDDSLRLLELMRAACTDSGFQQSVARIQKMTAQLGEYGARAPLAGVFGNACQSIILQFGFSGGVDSHMAMFDAIRKHEGDPRIVQVCRDIEFLLLVRPGFWFGIKYSESDTGRAPAGNSHTDGSHSISASSSPCQQAPRQVRAQPDERVSGAGGTRPESAPNPPVVVSVTVKHAVSEGSVTVRVDETASILDVRRAALPLIGTTKLSDVKLVKKRGMSFVSLADTDRLNGRRALLAMGVNFSST